MSTSGTYRIGADVGGTFTDVVLARPDGTFRVEKSPTTPSDQSTGVLDALNLVAAGEGLTLAELLDATDAVVHGTTTGDNTLIEMSGSPTGLICSEGFRDEMDLRRGYKEDIWDAALPAPPPIARRRVRLPVPERIDCDGNVVVALDEDAVRAAARRLRAFGVTSIAIAFLHSFVRPDHELRAGELVREEYPDVAMISLSHEVLPRAPEFERTSTTVVNAYVGPVIARYVRRLEDRLTGAGLHGDLRIVRSNGGVCAPAAIERRAAATIGSGPTGGAVAAAAAARAAGLDDVVSMDMGGTSYDMCLIRGGKPELKSDWNWRHRYCIATPMVDIHAIGAGGGSIARAIRGTLTVGPESAGAEPGPVCYGRGGTEPTVTDADLVLGRLDPAGFWGGRMTLDVDAARAALARVGRGSDGELGTAEETAVAVVRLVDAHMTDAIRRVLSMSGADPRDLDLVAFGGMGAVHATTQAADLGMRRVLVPRAAPGFSALGLLTADHVVDDTRAQLSPWPDVDLAKLNELADELARDARAELDTAGVDRSRVREEWFLNLVYPGQTFDNALPLTRRDGAPITLDDVRAAVEEFHRRNEEARLIEARAQEPSVRGVRLVTTGLVEQPAPLHLEPLNVAPSPLAHRRVHTGDGWHDEVPVYEGEALRPNQPVHGPAVVQYRFTTLVLRPGDTAEVHENGDTLVTVGA